MCLICSDLLCCIWVAWSNLFSPTSCPCSLFFIIPFIYLFILFLKELFSGFCWLREVYLCSGADESQNKTVFWFTNPFFFFCLKSKELLTAVLVQHKKWVSFLEIQILARGASSVRAGDERPLPRAWAESGSSIWGCVDEQEAANFGRSAWSLISDDLSQRWRWWEQALRCAQRTRSTPALSELCYSLFPDNQATFCSGCFRYDYMDRFKRQERVIYCFFEHVLLALLFFCSG